MSLSHAASGFGGSTDGLDIAQDGSFSTALGLGPKNVGRPSSRTVLASDNSGRALQPLREDDRELCTAEETHGDSKDKNGGAAGKYDSASPFPTKTSSPSPMNPSPRFNGDAAMPNNPLSDPQGAPTDAAQTQPSSPEAMRSPGPSALIRQAVFESRNIVFLI